MNSVRDDILGRLRKAELGEAPQRIELPPPYEAAFSREELIEKFAAKLAEQTGVFYRVDDGDGVKKILSEIVDQEGLKSVMASEDDLIQSLDLPSWGKDKGVAVSFPHDFDDRESYKNGVFNNADAGITVAVHSNGRDCRRSKRIRDALGAWFSRAESFCRYDGPEIEPAYESQADRRSDSPALYSEAKQ